jgi:hypothetical protein
MRFHFIEIIYFLFDPLHKLRLQNTTVSICLHWETFTTVTFTIAIEFCVYNVIHHSNYACFCY